jgi:transcription termination factor NusB
MDISRQSLLMIGVIEHNIIWTHQSVIVNECVELAKTYDDMSASKLINAILHRYFSWLSNPKITTSN